MSTNTEAFILDRTGLCEYLAHEHGGEGLGLDPDDLACSIVRRLRQAQDADAIGAPENTEIAGYAADDAVLVVIREVWVPGATYRRQLATCLVETRYLTDGGEGFTECCEALEACLQRASELMPELRLLQAAERMASARTPTEEQAADARVLRDVAALILGGHPDDFPDGSVEALNRTIAALGASRSEHSLGRSSCSDSPAASDGERGLETGQSKTTPRTSPLADRLEELAREVAGRTDAMDDWVTTLALQLSALGHEARESYERLLPAEGETPTAAQGVALARFLRSRLRESDGYATVTRRGVGLPDTYLRVLFSDGYEGGIDREGRVST